MPFVGASTRRGRPDPWPAVVRQGDRVWSGWLVFQAGVGVTRPISKKMGHPDLLVIDLGTNDLTCGHSTVAEVADDALRFLALLDDDVRPNMIILLSVIQRTSLSDRGGMTMSPSTFNRRAKAFNSRIAACVSQIANVRMFAQSRINFPRYISNDGCHLTEEGQARYIKGLRQAVLKCVSLC